VNITRKGNAAATQWPNLQPNSMETMNRHQRRVAKAQGIGKKLDPVIAIHEAGHAVARVLVRRGFWPCLRKK
jgi:hypothetical protein